ncbi:T9SS type A sorting domain-containing protein, partial [candidate division WOR-3 bacterium]|nr:T9SS type A sorting domain-containing protein [candidate division WOR-3 bacterium]
GVEESNNLNRIALYQITPNPFRTTTEIRYSIPIQRYVELKIYNLAGQLVKTLVNEQQKARTYIIKWNGRDDKGRSLPSGMYFIKLKVGNKFSQTKKLLLLR